MTKGTRYFVMASGAVLAAGMTAGLVASYMGVPVFSRAAAPDDLQYVPADAAVVAYANVREVMTSEFRQRFRKMEPHSTERDEFEARTGLDVERDIDSVVAALMPATDGSLDTDSPEKAALILARGRFDRAKLEALATEHGGKAEDYQGTRLLLHLRDDDGEDSEMAMGFVESDLVALGSAEGVRRAIDAHRSGRTIVSNTAIMQQVTALDGNNAWAVGRFDAVAGKVPRELQAQVPAVTWFSAAGHVNGGVSGVVRAEARDEAAAQNLHDMLRGFLALAKLQAGSEPALRQVVESLQLTGDGKVVSVQFALPTEVFDALEAFGKSRRGADERQDDRNR
jgi:hypothetical protein